jgi:hypothetical protein
MKPLTFVSRPLDYEVEIRRSGIVLVRIPIAIELENLL